MTRQFFRSTLKAALIFALVALVMMIPGTPSTAPVEAASPDLIFSLNYKAEYWSDPSYLIRDDGTLPWPGSSHGPLYAIASYSGWFWTTNTLSVISRNGFTGNVNLEVLNLPAGITSEMPDSVFVPKGGGVTIAVHLRAASSVALADVSGVTLRGTSGSIVKTANLPTFTVVQELPPLPN
jgi:hypothetical protein